MRKKIEINMDDATSVKEGLRLYRRQLFFSIITYPVYMYILYQFLVKGFQNNDYVPTKDDIFTFAKHNIIFFVIIGCIVIEPVIHWPFQFFKINRLKKRLEELKGPNKKTICSDVVKEGSMLVKINGKEVEVGPGRIHKKDCGCIGKFFQTLAQQAQHQKSSLAINGHEVNMDDPDDVQKAMKSCRIIGSIFLCLSGIILLVIGSEIDWTDFGDDVVGGIVAVSVWFLAGILLTFWTPRTLEKRLQELKKQGKVPSKNR